MWERTKRLINSKLDNLIERSGRPDSAAREVTRAEVARLNEVEAQALGSAKAMERDLAGVDAQIGRVSAVEQRARESGDANLLEKTASQLEFLHQQRDLLSKQIGEARIAAARARSLREERRDLGEQLATDTHLTTMKESLAGLQTPFDSSDPASVIDEMRFRLRKDPSFTESTLEAEADAEMARQTRSAGVEDLLAQYKQGLAGAPDEVSQPPARSGSVSDPRGSDAASESRAPAADDPEQKASEPYSKTLGPSTGPTRPID